MQVPNLSGVAHLAMGGLQAIAVKRGGPVLVWGGNEHGCLGHGCAASRPCCMRPSSPQGRLTITQMLPFLMVSLTCFAAANRAGFRECRQAGRAAREPVLLPKLAATAASCGWQHSAALGQNGELLTWGWGGSAGDQSAYDGRGPSGGQLGLGNDFDYWSPCGEVSHHVSIDRMMAAVHPPPVRSADTMCVPSTAVPEIQIGERALQQFKSYDARFSFQSVACGFNHTAAIVEIADQELEGTG